MPAGPEQPGPGGTSSVGLLAGATAEPGSADASDECEIEVWPPLAREEPLALVQAKPKARGRIIASLGQTWDSFFQRGPTVSDDFLHERANQHQPEREAL